MPTEYGFARILLHDRMWRCVEDLVIDVESGTFVCHAYNLDDPEGDSKESPNLCWPGRSVHCWGSMPMKMPPTGSPTRTDRPALDGPLR